MISKKIFSILTAICMLLTLCQFTFAADSTESTPDTIALGNGQYLTIGSDMNGLVGVSSSDPNPVPTDAKYTNGFYLQGAQVRVDSSKTSGLRFIIVNNTDMTAKMTAAGITDIKYGALVQLNKGTTLTFNDSVEVLAQNIFKTSAELNADYQKYTAVVTNIPDEYLREGIAVRPFVKYKDLSGNVQTIYGEQYACDIYITAYNAYNGTVESDSTKQILYSDILSKFADEDGNVPAANEFELTDSVLKKWRDKTDTAITKIRYTSNLRIPAGATVYYVSNSGSDSNSGTSSAKAWKTLSKVNSATLNAGDYVLFERGGSWRGQLNAKAGVTYSAYGEGDKPTLIGSPENGAGKTGTIWPKSKWTSMGNNIWRYKTQITDGDVGAIVFNEGEAYGTKWLILQKADSTLEEYKSKIACPTDKPYTALNQDLHFWHNSNWVTGNDGYVYLYSTSDPSDRFSSIEFLRNKNGIVISGNDITIDNIAVKYVGAHGIRGGGTIKGLTVTNCTLEWIGGSLQAISDNYQGTGAQYPIRYGNGVEIYGGCNGFTVKNCYFYQIYDAAVTHQIGMSSATDYTDTGAYNVTFSDNVMEYCTYSIEYWWKHYSGSNKPAENPSYMGNILYENNLMWYAGEGLGSQRPDNTQPAHIKGWTHKNYVNNFVLRNNLMAYSTSKLMDSNFNNYLVVTNNDWSRNGVTVENNILIGEYGQNFGRFGYNSGNKTDITYSYNMESTEKFLRDMNSKYLIDNEYYFEMN